MELEIGTQVIDSPVGPGSITGFSERGLPQVNDITVAWLLAEGIAHELVFDPYHVMPPEKHPQK